MKKIERLYNKVLRLQTKTDIARQEFAAEVVFSDEFETEPPINFAADGEMIAALEDGRECPAKDIVFCMLTKGVVENKDFS